MTALADHSHFQAFRIHCREQQPDYGEIAGFVDWMQEESIPFEELLGEYAGRWRNDPTEDYLSRTWREDEGMRLALATWLEMVRPKERVPFSDYRSRRCEFRWAVIRDCWLNHKLIENEARRMVDWTSTTTAGLIEITGHKARKRIRLAIRGEWLPEEKTCPQVRQNVHQAAARVCRSQKRKVLNLFPDVRRKARAIVPGEVMRLAQDPNYISRFLREMGFRTDLDLDRNWNPNSRQYEYTQVLAAPDWIPPESG